MKAIILDFWNTLAYRKGPSAKTILDVMGFPPKYEYYKIIDRSIGIRNVENPREGAELIVKEAGVSENLVGRIEEILREIERERMIFYPEVKGVLERLKKKYKLAVISNTNYFSMKSLPHWFEKSFDAVVFSYRVGMIKPDPRIYIFTLQKLGVKPEEAIMVGDCVRDDIKPPLELGMRAVLIRREKSLYSEIMEYKPVIRNLNELEGVFGFEER